MDRLKLLAFVVFVIGPMACVFLTVDTPEGGAAIAGILIAVVLMGSLTGISFIIDAIRKGRG